MNPCSRCGDLKTHGRSGECDYCLHGPMKIQEHVHDPKCHTCGRKVPTFRVGTEWGARCDAWISTATGDFSCESCPIPRKCLTCHLIFPSGMALHQHLRDTPSHQFCKKK